MEHGLRSGLRILARFFELNGQQAMRKRDLGGQMAAQGRIGDVGIAALPPRKLQHFGQAMEKIPLADALAIQHRVDKGGLVVARLLHGLTRGSIAVATGLDEELFDESHHEKEET